MTCLPRMQGVVLPRCQMLHGASSRSRWVVQTLLSSHYVSFLVDKPEMQQHDSRYSASLCALKMKSDSAPIR